MILHGSLTLADYLPGRSDVDLLVVVDGPLTDAQLADWEAIGDDAELTVLTTCRVWRFAEEGRHCSKTAAGWPRRATAPELPCCHGITLRTMSGRGRR